MEGQNGQIEGLYTQDMLALADVYMKDQSFIEVHTQLSITIHMSKSQYCMLHARCVPRFIRISMHCSDAAHKFK